LIDCVRLPARRAAPSRTDAVQPSAVALSAIPCARNAACLPRRLAEPLRCPLAALSAEIGRRGKIELEVWLSDQLAFGSRKSSWLLIWLRPSAISFEMITDASQRHP
jgi:hypothetical protein